MVTWLVVLYWLSMSPATHMSKLIGLRFCRRPVRCIVQRRARAAHRTETVNAERSKTRKHHRTDLITRLPAGWIYNRFFNNAHCSVSRSCLRIFVSRCVFIHGVNIKHTMRIKRRRSQSGQKVFGSALPWIINVCLFSPSQQSNCCVCGWGQALTTHLSVVLIASGSKSRDRCL